MTAGTRSILFIDDDFSEIINFQKYLFSLNLDLPLYTAGNFSDGLSILCGEVARVRPSILLMTSKSLKGITAAEFLSLVRNYYSLRHLKIFVVTEDDGKFPDSDVAKYDVAASLKKPLTFNCLDANSSRSGYNLLVSLLI